MWALRILRVHAGLSQGELGKGADIPQGRVSDLELGNRPSDVAELHRLAQALGVSPEVLLAGAITLSRNGSVQARRIGK